MWYVIQVRSGSEEKIRLQCRQKISEAILERCFIPHYEIRQKTRGTWRTVEKCLFPGYVFLVTENPEELFLALKKVAGMTKILGTGKDVVPLTDSEIAFLNRFGGKKQLVAISAGIIEGGQVRIVDGPLKGMEGMIRRIDRHKCKAWVQIPMFGRLQEVQVGLEILQKN